MEIKPERLEEFMGYAKFAVANKSTYKAIEAKTGVPWPLIAVIHRREGSARFDTYLGNGDPLNKKTVNVPANRGPFKTFEEGAIDALAVDKLNLVQDWRLEKMLYNCEVFNGPGYDVRGRPSSYVWAGTNIQMIGKYVGDGEWSASTWDTQPGCAPLLQLIQKLDPSVEYVRETFDESEPRVPVPAPAPQAPLPPYRHITWIGTLAGIMGGIANFAWENPIITGVVVTATIGVTLVIMSHRKG